MRLTYHVIDAFAERPFEGNPAGVCVLDEWLPDATMLAIAAAESKMLVRNKLVAFSALLMPFLFGFLMINMSENLGGFAFAASSLMISVVDRKSVV